MQSKESIEITGSPGSPYTRKMVAYLRFRGIPHKVHWTNGQMPEHYPKPKVALLPTLYFQNADGTVEAATDSSPLIQRLEKARQERTSLPSRPALRFLSALLEDYADEFMTKMMFHYRWAYEDSYLLSAPLIVTWLFPQSSRAELKQDTQAFINRQLERRSVVGSNPMTAPLIENAYKRLIPILDAMIERHGFLLGQRPSPADFAFFGQLTQLLKVDPVPARIGQALSLRVAAWLDLVDDLSGLPLLEDAWLNPGEDVEQLRELLVEIGRTYAPLLLANAKAIMAGHSELSADIEGQRWEQGVFPYQVKCLKVLREGYYALPEEERKEVSILLAGTGCEILFGKFQ